MADPLVTLALPLYKSCRFLDIIIENLETLAYPNLEILISDRHCADDAIDVLQARFGQDARFRFFRARDEINWVTHYNFLLRAATGKYFLWMAHDDSYSPNYVTALVYALEQHADAIVAYGTFEGIFPEGARIILPKAVPFSNTEPWTMHTAFRMFLDHQLGPAFHGVFRREPILQKGLFLLTTRDANAADFVWMFGIACMGPWLWTPDCYFLKRFYPTSTHAIWTTRTWRHTLAEIPIVRAYVVDTETSVPRRVRGWSIVLVWTLFRLGGNARDALHAHPALDGQIRRFLLKLNLW